MPKENLAKSSANKFGKWQNIDSELSGQLNYSICDSLLVHAFE